MSEFYYPRDLIGITKQKWAIFAQNIRGNSRTRLFFPNDANLLLMMDVMYHLSFEKEESRNIQVKIAYFSSSDTYLGDGIGKITKFKDPILFNKENLIRLSPAFNPANVILAVYTKEDTQGGESSDQMVIWGVILDSYRVSSPYLTLEITGPGELTVSARRSKFYTLKRGELLKDDIVRITGGIIGKYLIGAREKLTQEVIEQLTQEITDSSLRRLSRNMKDLYFETLERILTLIEKKRHGGTLIVLPDHSYEKEHLDIKYQLLNSPPMWSEFINYGVALGKYIYLNSDSLKQENAHLIREIELDMKLALRKINQYEDFFSSLSDVDGAVIITKKLEIIGFGAEIRIKNDELRTIKKAKDFLAEKTTELNILSYGTRHRSAIRYCNYNPNALAFVISQDGKIKAIKQHEGTTYLWNNVIS